MPNVRVVVRCRPFEAANASSPASVVRSAPTPAPAQPSSAAAGGAHWHLSGEQRIVLKAPASAAQAAGGTAAAADRVFQLNRVYGGSDTQLEFFQAEVRPLLDLAIGSSSGAASSSRCTSDTDPAVVGSSGDAPLQEGPTNVVLFAYGQTGSGKTHTVDGRRAAALAAAGSPSRDQQQPPPLRSGGGRTSGSPLWPATSPKRSESLTVDVGADTSDQHGNTLGIDNHSHSENDDPAARSSSSDSASEEEEHPDDTEDNMDTAGEGVAPRSLRYIFDTWKQQQEQSGRSPMHRYASASTPSNEPSPRHAAPPTTHAGGLNAAESVDAPHASGAPPAFELVRVSVSFLEIYNEKLFDLLSASCRAGDAAAQLGRAPLRRKRMAPSAAAIAAMHSECLRLRRSATSGQRSSTNGGAYQPAKFEVENLTKLSCIDLDEALEYYYYGVSKKVFRAHNLNSQSSRAHSIFTVYLTFRDNTVGDEGGGGTSEAPLITGEVAIVDLAGSERLNSILPGGNHRPSSSASSGERNHAALITESIHINKSLLTLGKVIMALSEGGPDNVSKPSTPRGASNNSSGSRRPTSRDAATPPKRQPSFVARHTPFRDSKLTMVMNHALGGNARTLMVACVHLDPAQVSETLSTLFYATRTNRIANVVVSLEDPKTLKIKMLAAEVATLKQELETANNTIAMLHRCIGQGSAAPPAPPPALPSDSSEGGRPSAIKGRPPLAATPSALPEPGVGLPTGGMATLNSTDVTSTTLAAKPGQDGGRPTTTVVPTTMAALGEAPPDVVAIPLDLSEKLGEACTKLKMVLEANARLRRAFDDERGRAVALERDREALETDNIRLREKLDLYDSLLLAQIAINREYDVSSSSHPQRKQLRSAGTHHHHHNSNAYRQATINQQRVSSRRHRAAAAPLLKPPARTVWTRETSDVLPAPQPPSVPPFAPQAPLTARRTTSGSTRPASASAGTAVLSSPRTEAVPVPPASFGAGVPLQFLLRGVPNSIAPS